MASQLNGNSSHSLEMANSNQGLVTRGSPRRWKLLGLVIAAVVTVAVVATVVVILNKPQEASTPTLTSLSLEDILERRFSPRQFNATWISDNTLFYDEGHRSYQPTLFNIETKEKRSPYDNPNLSYTVQTELSADKQYALEASTYRSRYRHSYEALYNITNVKTGLSRELTVPGALRPTFIQLAVWGPTNSSLVFVVGNNIWYLPDATASPQQITTTGIPETVYNGVPDWVYEEEVLSSNKALWFSPDGARLAFVTYNDTEVQIMPIPYYGRPGELVFQYTREYRIRYPKPRTHNPDVTLTVVDLRNPLDRITLPSPPLKTSSRLRLSEDQPVLAVTQWVPADPPQLLTVWMNRVQDYAVVQLCAVHQRPVECATLTEINVQGRGWVELFEQGITSNVNRSILLPLSQPVGGDSFRHITRFDPPEDSSGAYKMTALTHGAFVVTSILSWDHDNGYVYFESTSKDDPGRSLVQRVRDDPKTAPHEPECLSCAQEDCLWATASLSKGNSYLALTCGGPVVPYTVILSTKAKEAGKLTQVMNWESNDAVRQSLSTKALPIKKRFSVPLKGNLTGQVRLWLPPNADLSGNTKYPMLVEVYGGPNSFRVSERFAMDWGTYLSSNKSVIYAAIDGRGSGNKGDNTVFSIYRTFGSVEVEDQIDVTKHLQNTLPYIDAKKTAIWGWSYGGYASAMALAKDTDGVFKCGMSVAPVTDWIYYDSIYTERYMGLPTVQDNLGGYVKAQLNNKVENLRNKLFLLIHGTLDDNVHYQQSMMLSRALEEKDILFRQQSYTDEEHGISGLQPHLYHTLQNFLMECYNEV